ncbi:MAG: hypothetical protein Q7J27_10030 [Syntrophales bacterium]|nr:hypothetical protein [Syntrophales bacterium]
MPDTADRWTGRFTVFAVAVAIIVIRQRRYNGPKAIFIEISNEIIY